MQQGFTKKRIVISVLILAVLVAVLIQTNAVSWESVFQSLRGIGIQNLLLALCMSVSQYLCIAIRFVVLLPKASASVLRRQICRIYTNGQLLNHLVPARAGDLYKVIALKSASADPNFSSAYVVSALIIERIISTAVLVVLILVLVDWSTLKIADLSFPDRSEQLKTVFLAVLVVGVVLYFVQKKSKKLHDWLVELKRSFFTILNLRRFLLIVGFSVVMWIFEVLSMKFVAAPLGIDLQLGQGLFVLFLLNVGIAVPVTLGNIGTYEAALVVGLTLWGVGTNEAIAIALSHHFVQVLSLIILSASFNTLVYLFRGQKNRGQYTF